MSTQKKSLVSSLKTTKKAKVASTAKPIAKGEKNTSLMAIGSQHVSMRRK
jgi:hypothetical protein